MRNAVKVAVALMLLAPFAISFAMAAASPAPFQPPPVDPQLQNATPYMISLKAFDQCQLIQSRLMNQTREQVHTPCSCYAKKTIGGMSKPQLDFFRSNGYFDDDTRAKAVVNLESCGLKRPPGL
jgi:hypothetical protein